jgi:hypothetical protein
MKNVLESGWIKPIYKNFALAFLLKYKNIPLFEKLYVRDNKNVKSFNPNYEISQRHLFLEEAAESGDTNIVNYALKIKPTTETQTGKNKDVKHLSIGAAKRGDIEMLSYVTDSFKELNFREILKNAAIKGQIEFIRSFVQPENRKILLKDLPYVIETLAYSDTTDVLSPEKTENTLRFLLDTYFSIGGKIKSFSINPHQELENKRIVRIFKEYGF